MVRVSSMLLATALSVAASVSATAATSAYDALPTFAIPAFDYETLGANDAPERLLRELQANGIVALKNVPNYANVRAQYLQKAAECAVVAADAAEAASFLSQKTFADGTRRLTISTNAGAELADAAANTQTTCPGYQALYQEFSQIIERAVHTFGSTLDATSFTASDGAGAAISSRKLVSEAIRLDHFHAYQAPVAAVSSSPSDSDAQPHRELAFSLPLHEDHGLFIAMSAPKFFDVEHASASAGTSDRKLVERALAADKSGLVIQTSAGQRVRPVLNDDEVVIMMGTGASRWLQTSHALPAVLHGMKMPESIMRSGSSSDSRSLRAWFGKMTLLPAYQRMLQDQRVAFDAHVNATTRYLLQKGEDESELKTIGCAGERRLEASEGSCMVRTCTTKSGATAPSEGCATICNRVGHSEDDAKDCAAKCTCSAATASGELCWMLCVANLPTDQCAKSDQTCKGQEISCTKPIASAAPTTAPSTPSSSTTPSATPKPANGTATNPSAGAGSKAGQSSAGASATVTAPTPTTAAPKSAAATAAMPSVALVATVTAAIAHTMF